MSSCEKLLLLFRGGGCLALLLVEEDLLGLGLGL